MCAVVEELIIINLRWNSYRFSLECLLGCGIVDFVAANCIMEPRKLPCLQISVVLNGD